MFRCVFEEVHCVAVCVLEGRKALMDDYTSGSKERKRLLERRYGRSIMLFTKEELMSEEWLTNNSKNCPHCFSKIEVCIYCGFTRY